MDGLNRRQLGGHYETLAAQYLENRGYVILERNYHHHKNGELDLVAKKDGVLVFVEVKYRSTGACGDPLEAVTKRKRRTISRMALAWLANHSCAQDTAIRFDAIGIYGDGGLKHVENAFEYTER